jgi:hypothetical protein
MTPEQVAIFKTMTPARKLELAAQFNAASRELKTCALRAQHPDWSEEQIRKRVRELFLYAST